MADIDILPPRGVPVLALVDGTGIASNGSQTVAQLAARGMRSVCAVDATGVSVSGATMLQLAQRGIQAFCPVDELGVAQSGATAAALQRAGIRPMVLLGANGLALTGSATMLTLAQRGLSCFCPVDEAGNATTMGAVILVTNTNVLETATIGTNVGTLSVAGGTGTYTFSLTDSAGGKFAVAGTNGVNLNTAATLNYATAPSHNITVSATNGGTPITRTIVITVVMVPVLPANAGGANLPAISGSTVVGGVLTSTTGTWTGNPPPTYAYQWKRGATNVGTNLNTYTTVAADIGSTMTVVVTATNAAGSVNATSAATAAITGIAPVNTVLPAISGSSTQGATLTATTGTWTGSPTPTYAYQWKSAGVNVGTNSSTYATVAGDVGNTITVVVTATNVGGSANATSAAFGPVTATAVAPANTVLPAISGSTTVGGVLTATSGTWTGTATITYAYQWKRGATDVGTNSTTYTTVSGDIGSTITVTVTATNVAGNASATSLPTAAITDVASLPAPTLAWTSANTVYDPVFTLTFFDAVVGDVLLLEVDNNSDFSSLHDSETDTLDSTEIAAGSITYSGFTTLTGGVTYYARVKLTRGAASVYSNTVNQTMFLDVTAPTVTSYSPLDNATNVVTTVELVVIFNETVTLGTSGTISLKKTSDNSTIDSWDVPADNGSGAGQLQVVSGTELHMHLTTALANSTEYYVVWPAGVIKDTTGNGVAAQSSTTLWSFTTAAAAPAWTPLLASTPAMFWVDATNAASITKTGTAPNEIVTAWNDLTSGTPHNLTPGINGGPVYVASAMNSKPGISFINNGSLNTVSFTTPPPIMVVIVWRQTAALGAANAMLFESDTISHTGFIIFNRFNSSTYKVVVQSGNYLDNGTITANTNYHSRFLIDGSTSSSTLNGSTVSGIINGWDPITTGLTLGNVDSASNGPNAIICEAFIIKYADHAAAVANAPTDATNAAAYVLAKWGV